MNFTASGIYSGLPIVGVASFGSEVFWNIPDYYITSGFKLHLNDHPLSKEYINVYPLNLTSQLVVSGVDVQQPTVYSRLALTGVVQYHDLGGYSTLDLFSSGLVSSFNGGELFYYLNGGNRSTNFSLDNGWYLENYVLPSGSGSPYFYLIFSKLDYIYDNINIGQIVSRNTSWELLGDPSGSDLLTSMTGLWEYGYIKQTDDISYIGRSNPILDFNFQHEKTVFNYVNKSRIYNPIYGFAETSELIEIINPNDHVEIIIETGVENTGILYNTGLYEENWYEENWYEGPYDTGDWTGSLTKNTNDLEIWTDTGFDTWATWQHGLVDLTDWSGIQITWAGSYTGAADLNSVGFLGVDTSSGTGYLSYSNYLTTQVDFSTVDTLDISANSGDHYISIGLRTTGKSNSVQINISKVELI